MDRDRALGFLVFIVAIVIFIGYSYYALIQPLDIAIGLPVIDSYWVLAVPLWIGITVVLLIGAWIGWTLFTTPPPVPIEEFEGLEDFTTEMEEEEESEMKAEESAEEE